MPARGKKRTKPSSKSSLQEYVGGGLKPGDHIAVCRGLYYHHGIIVPGPQPSTLAVIHYYTEQGKDSLSLLSQKKKAAVQKTTLEQFIASSDLDSLRLVRRPADPGPVLARAQEALRTQSWQEGSYDVALHNCEHFATWCIDGQPRSDQVRLAVASVGGIAMGTALWPLVRGLTRQLVTKSIPGVGPVAMIVGSTMLMWSGLRALSGAVGGPRACTNSG